MIFLLYRRDDRFEFRLSYLRLCCFFRQFSSIYHRNNLILIMLSFLLVLAMARSIPGDDIYGAGSWIDPNPLPVLILDSVSFQGNAGPVFPSPGPLKPPVIAAALHAMFGIVANELLHLGDRASSTVSINTDQAAFWLGSVGMTAPWVHCSRNCKAWRTGRTLCQKLRERYIRHSIEVASNGELSHKG